MLKLPAKLRAFYALHPVAFVREIIGAVPDSDQVRFLNSVRDSTRTVWRTGHGVGKSAAASWLVIWWTYCLDPALVLCTAPTRDQLYDVLWRELAKWLAQSKVEADLIWTATALYVQGNKERQTAQARTSNNPQSLAGRHEENLLLLCEEASAIPEAVFEPLQGSLTAKHCRLVMIGNPTQTQGTFYNAFHREANDYCRLHTPGEGHLRASQGDNIARIVRRYGRDSDVYRVRVAGEFPVGDPGTFITLARVEAAQMRDVNVPDSAPWCLGVDVAGMGDDRTVLLAMKGLRISPDIRIYHRLRGAREVVEPVLAYVRELRKDSRGPVLVAVDGGGLGWGPGGDLAHIAEEEPGLMVVVQRNFGGAGDGEYHSEASWMWGKLREHIDTMQIPRDADQLAEEICNRRYDTEKGKIRIEPKDQYKERHEQSPDLADAAVLAVSLYGWEPPASFVIPSRIEQEGRAA